MASSARSDVSAVASEADPREVIRMTQDLIRMNTTNYGTGRAEGEDEAADYVRALLEDVGLRCELFRSEPGRTSLVTRWPGQNRDAPALMLHGHLDVVPADSGNWTVDPFSAEVRGGAIWGRGAVDMKGMDAMILASVRDMIRRGEQPHQDVVIAMFADEESGSTLGSDRLVKERPELLAGVTAAISEVGGYSIDIAGKRAYLLQTGEKGVLWLELTAEGTAGHGSQIHTDTAIVRLVEAISRIGRAQWPVSLTGTTADTLDRVRALAGLPPETDPAAVVDATGFGARFIAPSLRNVVNTTMISGGYKENVVPERASAFLDIRCLPGQQTQVLERIRELAGPDVHIDIKLESEAVESPFDGGLVEQIITTIHAHDPEAEVLPYLLPAGTDNKQLAKLGIRGFGFAPLKLPADFDYPSLFHGVDERVPIESLIFGQHVLADLLRTYRAGAGVPAG